MTIGQALVDAIITLQPSVDHARFEALLMMEHSLQKPRSWLIAHDEENIGPKQQQAFESLLKRRARGEPLAYITGKREFWSLTLEVTPDVLIPRPETELLVEAALSHIPTGPGAMVADLGTGSGAIALALACERPHAAIYAVEYHPGALGVAQRNARHHQLSNVIFIHGPWFSPINGQRFDVIVSNPPYVEKDDPHLDDLGFEPVSALVSGEDGLDALRQIIGDAPPHLNSDGWLLVEHGAEQGKAVRQLFESAGFCEVETRQDLAGLDRISLGRIPANTAENLS